MDSAGTVELAPAGVEPIEINFLRLEVLRGNAQRIALDAGIDVLGDEDGVLALLHQVVRNRDDAVVGRVVASGRGRA